MWKTAGQGQNSVWRRQNLLQTVTPNEGGVSYLICGWLGLGSLSSLAPRTTNCQKLLNAENGKRPVAAAEPITKRAISRDGKAVADRLRLRLALREPMTLDRP